MKWLNDYELRLMFVGVVVAMVVGGGSRKADFTFGEPVNLGPTINSSFDDFPNCFSADGLEMYLDSKRSGGYGYSDIWVSKRPTTNEDWSTPENLGSLVNTGDSDFASYISADGLELYFTSYKRSGGYGEYDIWMATRQKTERNPEGYWGEPQNLGPLINSEFHDTGPSICSDELELYFTSTRPGGCGGDDLWLSRRATENDPWGEPINLGLTINSSYYDGALSLSVDGRMMFFTSRRPGGSGDDDLWVTTRSTTSDLWGPPLNLGPVVNSSYSDFVPCISSDGHALLFGSNRPDGFGAFDIWQAPIIPIVDFNGDGIVDSADMIIMVDHWGTDNSLCDIGPMPWGDGVVDVQDLIVLAEHLFEEFPPAQ